MLDTQIPALQRTRGAASVALGVSAGVTRIQGLRQEGSAKAFLPRTDADHPEVVFLNTAGGLTGGDTLSYRLALAEGGRATGTTQTAERAYAQGPLGPAEMRVQLRVGAGARLDWLPQETILFDGSASDPRGSEAASSEEGEAGDSPENRRYSPTTRVVVSRASKSRSIRQTGPTPGLPARPSRARRRSTSGRGRRVGRPVAGDPRP